MIAKNIFGNAKNQALLTALLLIAITAVLVQFFFLGEELEESRSRAAKLSIAEIIAKNQQQNDLQQVSYGTANNEFARVASTGSQQTGQLSADRGSATGTDENSTARTTQELRNFSRGLELQGIIRNERYSLAIVRMAGQQEIQTLSSGSDLGNGISITEVRSDAIVLSKNDAQLVVRINGSQQEVTDESLLNLPGTKR